MRMANNHSDASSGGLDDVDGTNSTSESSKWLAPFGRANGAYFMSVIAVSSVNPLPFQLHAARRTQDQPVTI
jgi:hypothetical protein